MSEITLIPDVQVPGFTLAGDAGGTVDMTAEGQKIALTLNEGMSARVTVGCGAEIGR